MSDPTKSRLIEARTVAIDLLEKMETSELPIERHLMQAKRLARLLRDTDARQWLDYEIAGYPSSLDSSTLGHCLQYAKSCGRITADDKYYTSSLPELEASCEADRKRVEGAIPKPITETAADYLVAGATSQMYTNQLNALLKIKQSYLSRVALFSSLKTALHSYVSDTLISIEFGDYAESIFDDLRHEVDAFIRSNSPKAAEKLLAIAERMSEGNGEAYAEALTSCRRLLMSVADSVFPPSDNDWVDGSGRKHKVGTENYKNRLIAFIESRLESESTRMILENELEHLSSRLDAVYEKSCKGVHSDVTIEETRLTIIGAYIFIGEIARLQKTNDAIQVSLK